MASKDTARLEDLPLYFEGGDQGVFENEDLLIDIDNDDSQLRMAEKAVMQHQDLLTEQQVHDMNQTPAKPSASGHLFQEMMVVKTRLDFDEQEFRQRVHESSMKVSQEFKEIVMELYDAVDKMVNDVSKAMHQAQTGHYQEFDAQLSGIRRQAVDTETLDQSIKKFLGTVAQAFQQSFAELD